MSNHDDTHLCCGVPLSNHDDTHLCCGVSVSNHDDTHLCCGVSVSNQGDIHLEHNGLPNSRYGTHPYSSHEQYNLDDLPPHFLENDVSEAHIENAASQEGSHDDHSLSPW